MQIVLHTRVSGVRMCPNKALTRFFQVVSKLYKREEKSFDFSSLCDSEAISSHSLGIPIFAKNTM